VKKNVLSKPRAEGRHAKPQNVTFSEVTLEGSGREKRDLLVF